MGKRGGTSTILKSKDYTFQKLPPMKDVELFQSDVFDAVHARYNAVSLANKTKAQFEKEFGKELTKGDVIAMHKIDDREALKPYMGQYGIKKKYEPKIEEYMQQIKEGTLHVRPLTDVTYDELGLTDKAVVKSDALQYVAYRRLLQQEEEDYMPISSSMSLNGKPVTHKAVVKSMIDTYRKVDDEVLKDYPDLKKKQDRQIEAEKISAKAGHLDRYTEREALNYFGDPGSLNTKSTDEKIDYLLDKGGELYKKPPQSWLDESTAFLVKNTDKDFVGNNLAHVVDKKIRDTYPDVFGKTPPAFKNYVTFDNRTPSSKNKGDIARVYVADSFSKWADKGMPSEKLDLREKVALESYKGSMHNLINPLLAGRIKETEKGVWKNTSVKNHPTADMEFEEQMHTYTKQDIDQARATIKRLDDAIFHTVTRAGSITYTGFPSESLKPKYNAGDIIRKGGYVSTSTQQHVAKIFAGASRERGYQPAIMKVYIPKGAHAIPIEARVSDYYRSRASRPSYYTRESEVVLPRETSFRVLSDKMVFDPESGKELRVLEVEVMR
jgi:hypothetical protein